MRVKLRNAKRSRKPAASRAAASLSATGPSVTRATSALSVILAPALVWAAVLAGQDRLAAAGDEFPPEITRFEPAASNPVFTAEGPGHWDVKMRERGWILREGPTYHLWYSGYDGTRAGLKMLGYATSP